MSAAGKPPCPVCGGTRSSEVEDFDRPAVDCLIPVRRCASCGTHWRGRISLWLPVHMLLAGAVLIIVGKEFLPEGRTTKFEYALRGMPFYFGIAMVLVGLSGLRKSVRMPKIYPKPPVKPGE